MSSTQSTSPMLRIEPISGAGLGVSAVSFIPRGTRIISESPLFTVPATFEMGVGLSAEVQQELDLLSPDQKLQFSALHNAHGLLFPPELGIIRTNALPLGVNATHGAIFLVCSRFNHSCDPNANYSWNSKLGAEVVYAIRDIQAGEQITVSYLLTILLPRQQRREALLRDFSFLCCCSACESSPAETSASDVRRSRASNFNMAALADGLQPARALGYCRMALALLKEENLDGGPLQLAYWNALQICVEHGDLARGSAFATLAAVVMELMEGKESTELKETKSYIKHPERHRIAGAGNWKAWRTRTKMAKKAGSEGFDEWLWSRAV